MPAIQKTWKMQVWSLGWKHALEEGMATHSSILAWVIPWTEESGWLQSKRSQRVGQDWVTEYTYIHIKQKWDIIPTLWPPDAKNWLIGKDPDAGKDRRQEEKGMTNDEMVGWHHWLDGHGFGQALGVGDGQGSLEFCSPWDRRVWHDWATELNWC